jgi:DNA-binding response OmpR family regulator
MADVLVVDDSPQIRTILSLILEDAGLSVEGAADGAAALDVLTEAQPRVIVLDLAMPVMRGEEFFRRLRAQGDDIPVLILSAENAAPVCREIGADDALAKPFDNNELVDHVESLLRRERSPARAAPA